MFLRFVVAVSLLLSSTAAGQAVRPAPYRPPPAYTPGYAPGTPAEPVYAPVGAGVPGERVPGAVAPAVPRSEGRILPRTDEPGLWAADGDPALMAVGSRERLKNDVLGVDLPSTLKGGAPIVRVCRQALIDALNSAQATAALEQLDGTARRCEILRLQEDCLERLASRKNAPGSSEENVAQLRRTARERQAACEGRDRKILETVRAAVAAQLRKSVGSFKISFGYGEPL